MNFKNKNIIVNEKLYYLYKCDAMVEVNSMKSTITKIIYVLLNFMLYKMKLKIGNYICIN